jgi:hypothetical protein
MGAPILSDLSCVRKKRMKEKIKKWKKIPRKENMKNPKNEKEKCCFYLLHLYF